MGNDVSVKFDKSKDIYTFTGNFGVNFRAYMINSILNKKKFDLLFRSLSFREIVIDSFFVLELREICNYILDGSAPYSSWVNLKSLEKLRDAINEHTWLNPNEYAFEKAFKLDMDLLNKTVAWKPKDFQEIIFKDYEDYKNILGYRGMLLDAGTGVGKTGSSLFLSIAAKADLTIIIAMNVSLDATWKNTLINNGYFNKEYELKDSDIFMAEDYARGKRLTNEKYIIFNYEALDKLNSFIGKESYRNIFIIVDEVHNFTSDSKRKEALVTLVNTSKSNNVVLMSGTTLKKSALELIAYLEILCPEFNVTVRNRFKKLYGSPNHILKACIPIRYGILATKIEKDVLNLEPIGYKNITLKLKNGFKYTLKNTKEEMKIYLSKRMAEIESNLYIYKNEYTRLLEKAKVATKIPIETWIEYEKDFNLVMDYYAKRQLMFHSDLIKRVNEFEKIVIMPNLSSEEKKIFKEAAVVLKYPMFKVRGEILGRVVLGNRIQCHKEMAANLDYTILDSTTAKGIIMTSYREIGDIVVEKLKQQKYHPVAIYGDNTKFAKNLIQDFIEIKRVNPLVGTYKSISTGLHLVVANLIILLDLPYRGYSLEQAIARVHRMGQEKQVIVIYTTLDTGEEYNLNSRNIDILKWSLEAVAEITGYSQKGLEFDESLELSIIDEGLEGDIKIKYDFNPNALMHGLMSDMSEIYIDIEKYRRDEEVDKKFKENSIYLW